MLIEAGRSSAKASHEILNLHKLGFETTKSDSGTPPS